MNKLPTQLKWSQFVQALKGLGFQQLASKGGSARHFQRLSDQSIHTVHEPHGGDTLRQGTLREYLRHMGIDRDIFLQTLAGMNKSTRIEEERFRHTLDTDGVIISNCNQCFSVVARSKFEEEICAAEAQHLCTSE